MKRLTVGLVLFLLAAAPASATEPDLPAVLTQAMEGQTVPAAGVLVIRDGSVTGQAVRGVRVLGKAEPVTLEDRWNLGSDGKAMTATMVGRLVERGLLRWDAPLSEMMPDLAADMRPEYRDVTLIDLLSHRAGLPENVSDEAFYRSFYKDSRPPPAQRIAYLKRALSEAPVGPARGEPSYSNSGPLLAAAIAERVTGKPYEQLMQDEVFGPLGMTSAVFGQTPGAGDPWGHVDGRIADRPFDANTEFLLPAGGVRMSLADWARFCIDQLKGEDGAGLLLKAETYRQLHTPQGETIFALGWGVAPQMAGRLGPVLTHSGSDGNWFAFVALFPTGDNGVLVVANAADSMGGDAAARSIARAVMMTLAPPVPAEP